VEVRDTLLPVNVIKYRITGNNIGRKDKENGFTKQKTMYHD
jgi:hypothetical protein